MRDAEKTAILTKIGYLQLKNMGCYLVSTEVKVPAWSLRDFTNEQDRHFIIDLIGIGWKYLPPSQQYTIKVQRFDDEWRDEKIIKEPILRGVEIKVSRSDFKNGFIHCGSHYNYIMVPKDLVDKKEVYRDIGIIEVDLENFKFVKTRAPYPHKFEGLEIVRKPTLKHIPNTYVEEIHSQIGRTLTNQVNRWLIEEMVRFQESQEDV